MRTIENHFQNKAFSRDRYAFNGMEKDDEVKGSGNSYTTEFRQLDVRLGRWLSIDPEFRRFSWQSPYVTFDNNPIKLTDPKGLAAGDGDEMKKKSDADCADCESQTLKDGFGNVEKQQFTATTKGTKEAFEKFKETFTTSPQKVTNNVLAKYMPVDMDESGDLTEGDHIDIDIFGPDNGTVRVAKIIVQENSFELYFQALDGHPDAGNIRFSGTFEDGKITFEVFNITRVNLGWYSDAYPFGYKISPKLARAAQKTQWRIVLGNFAALMGTPTEKSENIEVYKWDDEKQTIGSKIE